MLRSNLLEKSMMFQSRFDRRVTMLEHNLSICQQLEIPFSLKQPSLNL